MGVGSSPALTDEHENFDLGHGLLASRPDWGGLQ